VRVASECEADVQGWLYLSIAIVSEVIAT